MTRLFLRFYLALAAVVLAAVAVLVVSVRLDGDVDPIRLQALATAAHQVSDELALATDPAHREQALEELSATLEAEVQVAPLAQVLDTLDPLASERLERGEPVVTRWGDEPAALVVRVPDQPLVAIVATGAASPARWGSVASVVLLGLGLALAVLATLRPLQRQLEGLSDAAERFGAGSLEARAQVRGEDAAARLARSFNEMATRVERLIAGREELLLAVAHELRHPVARIRFAVELLAETEDLGERTRQAEEMQADLESLDRLVGELTTWTRLEDGRAQLHREPFALGPLLDEVVDAARRAFPEAEIHRAPVPGALDLLGDRRLLERALTNLLTNAVRYGRGRVRVEARSSEDRVKVYVDDDGPGIPPPDRERVFEPLVRLDAARSRDTGGVGLGLALARGIARGHGGEVTATDSPLGGARLTMELPTP